MTPQEITNEALVPNTRSVFVLGSYEKRVTVYAQQVRALNLVDAILSQALIREKGKVAIVGGGAAGITAAVALARAASHLAAIDLFESRTDILELQWKSTRYLHPHFYDWPAPGSNDTDAGLPIMNWQAGPAGQVADTLRAQFEEATHSSILTLYPGQRVTELKPSALGGVRLVVPGTSALGKIYDVVILALGFGLERFLDGDTPSYWTPTHLAGPIHTQIANPVLFVSGNGDGGLVDFMMAALNALEHREICELLMTIDLGPALTELQAIESEAWGDNADIDFLQAYRTRIRHLIPAATWADIRQRLRPNVCVKLHTRQARLLRRDTALHNRLGTFLILEADADAGRNAIEVYTGVDFDGGVAPVRNEIRLAGQTPFTPFRRFLRLGADGETNLRPFSNLLNDYPGRTNPPASAVRPASPFLTASARSRFAPYARALPYAATAAAPALAPAIHTQDSIILTMSGGNQVSWNADLDLADIDQIWSNNRNLAVYSKITGADAADLMPVIARLGAHAHTFTIYTDDVHGWRAGLGTLCGKRSLPSPDVTVRCDVREWIDPPATNLQTIVDHGHFSEQVHLRLDAEVLRQLRTALYEMLGPPAIDTGWLIEPQLRHRLWETWEVWHASLTTDPQIRRRFLRLLASSDDHQNSGDTDLIRVGPKIVTPFLTKPAIFGLTFATCSGHQLIPTSKHPGNVIRDVLTGHACGVGWIKGRDLGIRCISEQLWTTGLVLLPQLREPFQLVDGNTRFDRTAMDSPMVGTISPGEEPLIIGADGTFVRAIESGEQAVHDYFQSIFRWRSEVVRQTIEGA